MNTSFWSNLNKYDKRKLIYAYIISPLIIMGSLGSNLTSGAYSKTGQVIIPPCGAVFGLAMMAYLPAILPAIAIRFGYFKRALSYGLELFVSMWVSIIMSLLLLSFMLRVPAVTQGFLGTLTVYCVLSYCSIGYNNIPKQTRYGLTVLNITIPFVAYHMLGAYHKQGFALFWEAVFMSIIVNCHLPKTSETIHNSSSWQSTTTNHFTEPPKSPPPHSEPHEVPNPHQQDAVRFVRLGLAAIGRKTVQPNPYLTPEREAQRRNAERYFLLQLAAKYKDVSARKVLAKHFMLYKEACLYIVFASLLKDNPELHSIVKVELTKQLSEGLSAKALIRRKEYMFAFSRAFYDEYHRTRSVERVLGFMFWSVLRDKHPELESEELDGLGQVYRYEYEAVKF